MEQENLRYGDFAYLKVKEITNFGAFLDTGADKDLLLPFSEQAKKVEQGKGYIVAIIVDELTERPIATQKYRKYINEDTSSLKVGQEVDLLLTHFTTLGANVIIENELKRLTFICIIQQILKKYFLKGYIYNQNVLISNSEIRVKRTSIIKRTGNKRLESHWNHL